MSVWKGRIGLFRFGGIDVVINNASAISLASSTDTSLSQWNLMHEVNVRGSWLVTKYSIPHLLKSFNPQIIFMSPPIDLNPKWFKGHTPYTTSKFGMSMLVLGLSQEFPQISVNALWPRTIIQTAALNVVGSELNQHARKPSIMADAVLEILKKKGATGNFFIDEQVLKETGVTDFSCYLPPGVIDLAADLFVENQQKSRI